MLAALVQRMFIRNRQASKRLSGSSSLSCSRVIGAALLRVNRVAFSAGTAHHLLSILLSPNRSRIIVSQSAEELESGDGFAIAHDVRRPGV